MCSRAGDHLLPKRGVGRRRLTLKVDSDRYPDLVQQFGVNALPCDVFVGPDGKVLKVNQGAVSADVYKALISNVARTSPAVRADVNMARN